MITVVALGIQTPGNLGAIARVMKNFEVSHLVLIDPQCNPSDDEALERAMHAKAILKKVKIKDKSYLKSFDYLIATTAKTGSDYNIPRVPLSPSQCAEKLALLAPHTKIAILLGKEDHGLTNEEIKQCDMTLSIPTSPQYPTLNISHALSIILYELFKATHEDKSQKKWPPASKKEKEVILTKIDHILDTLEFSTPEKKETQRILWKRLIGKAMLTKREAFALLGFLRKLE